jgi:exodeoxyribonuclease III
MKTANSPLSIVTYNLNGIRSAFSKGLLDWIIATDADVYCFQELKATADQIDQAAIEQAGYHCYWYPAQKKGYSGVGIIAKIKPDKVVYGSGILQSDVEGRTIRIDFGDLSIMSIYAPSGTSGDERQAYKMEWLASFKAYIQKLKTERSQLILVGDFNICHQAIDIHNPVSNAKSSGFLPEERAWMQSFFEDGFIDAFRHLHPIDQQYTWWSFRFNARSKNLGWRIDYQLVSETLASSLERCIILPQAMHSDHCPVLATYKI